MILCLFLKQTTIRRGKVVVDNKIDYSEEKGFVLSHRYIMNTTLHLVNKLFTFLCNSTCVQNLHL